MKITVRLLLLCFVLATNPTPIFAQWIQTNGPSGGYVFCFGVSDTNLYAGTSGAGVFLTTNRGTDWEEVNSGLTNNSVQDLTVLGTNLFAGTYGAGVFRITINDTNWSAVNTGLTNDSVLALAVYNTNLYAGTWGGGVFVSTDNGALWTGINSGLSNILVQALAVSDTNLFAGTYGGGVFRTAINETSWTEVNTGLTNTEIGVLTVLPAQGGSNASLFAVSSDGVFRTTDNGANWIAVNSGLFNPIVTSLGVSGANLFAGTFGSGVFLSTNDGTSWNPVNDSLSNPFVWALGASGTDLFAGTWGDGVWRRPLNEMVATSSVKSQPDLPAYFYLGQNYPNPFNPTTRITFQIPDVEFVSLKVFDMLGHEVGTLVDEQRQPGAYTVSWDARNLASGMYFYRLNAGSFSQTKKLVVLR
jgi:Secretion system C-terminal sorting domain